MYLSPREARALRRIEDQLHRESPHLHDLFAQLHPAAPNPPPPPITPTAFRTAIMFAMLPVIMVAALWLLLPATPSTCTDPARAPAPPPAAAAIRPGQPTAVTSACPQPLTP